MERSWWHTLLEIIKSMFSGRLREDLEKAQNDQLELQLEEPPD